MALERLARTAMTDGSSRARSPEAIEPAAAAAGVAAQVREPALKYLRDLIRIPTDNPPGACEDAAVRVEREFAALGIPTQRLSVPGAADRGTTPVVLGWLGPRTETPDLILNAHVDASPPGSGWTVDPYAGALRGGRIHGRGAVLSKADVAAYTHGAAAARAAGGPASERTVLVAITADEGSGGDHGPRYLLETLGLRPQRAICAGFTHAVGVAHNGCVQLELTIEGRATHTALAPPSTDAMRAALAVAQRAHEVDGELRGRRCAIPGIASPTLSVTRVRGGEWFGLATGSVEVWLDRRVTPEESTAEALDALNRMVADVLARSDTSVAVQVAQIAEPLRVSESQLAWGRELQGHARSVLGDDVPLRGLPLYTDARWFGSFEIPTVLYGVGDEELLKTGINGTDESAAIDDLASATEVVARAVGSLIGTGREPAGHWQGG